MTGELFPTDIRATAGGIVMALGKATLVANYKFFPIAVTSFGFHYVFYFYSFITALMAMLGFLTIEDTDQLSLTEVHNMLKKKNEVHKERKSLLH